MNLDQEPYCCKPSNATADNRQYIIFYISVTTADDTKIQLFCSSQLLIVLQIISTRKTSSNLHISVPIGSKSAITFLNDLLWFIDPDRESDWGDHWVVLDDHEFIYVPLDIPCGGTIMRTMEMIMTIMTYYALSQ